jgi:osmotically-inducible protein OsmY
VAPGTFPDGTPANDALLVQLVRGALGRQGRCSGSPRINVSSCKLVVTLHGIAGSVGESDEIEAAIRAVPGVRDVSNKLRVTQGASPCDAVSERAFRGI